MKRILALVLAIAMVFALCACGPDLEEVVGTWAGSYTYEGNNYHVVVVLHADGSYTKTMKKNGSLSSAEHGDYEIDGNKVILYDSSALVYHGMAITYAYRNGKLVNNGHPLSKAD